MTLRRFFFLFSGSTSRTLPRGSTNLWHRKGSCTPHLWWSNRLGSLHDTVLIPHIEYFVQYKRGFLEALNNSIQQLLFDENKCSMEIQKLRKQIMQFKNSVNLMVEISFKRVLNPLQSTLQDSQMVVFPVKGSPWTLALSRMWGTSVPIPVWKAVVKHCPFSLVFH